MSQRRYLFTSESVSMGHPDKVADQISDAMLDYCLAADPLSRVACETLVTTNLVVVAGEVTTKADLTPAVVERIARETIRRIGYNDPKVNFAADTCEVRCYVHKQAAHIAMGVDTGGAGDQGMMFGYACNETDSLMPLPIYLAHRLVEKHAAMRGNGELPFILPDAKSQITIEYLEDHTPHRIRSVVLSTQHDTSVLTKKNGRDYFSDDARRELIAKVIRPTLEAERPELIKGRLEIVSPGETGDQLNEDAIRCYINQTGAFLQGGPDGDCGLTGRKIIVDTYGGRGRHGGGSFSGKDPSKVDRSAAYMARYIAKNIVAAELADRCEVQLSYVIGHDRPTSVHVDCQGTAKVSEEIIDDMVRQHFKLTPRGIIEALELLHPIYSPTAVHGHFGRNPGTVEVEVLENGRRAKKTFNTFTWERTDKAQALRAAAEKLVGAIA